jgi:2-(1,2-epoxy-1,2-dihydrophenyl)acetyl-CoA isomerase
MTDVLVDRQDDILVLTLNRPARLNALSIQMREILVEELTRELVGPTVRAVLLTGAGKGFCSGADLEPGKMLGSTSTMEGRIQAGVNHLTRLLHDVPVPVIAAINGPAAGAGAGLALACDLIVMAETAKLHVAFSNIGLVMDGGVSHALTVKLGSARATSLAMLGGHIDAPSALNWGLATEVMPTGGFADGAMAFARKVAARPTVSLGLIKKQVQHAETATIDDALRFEAACQGIAASTDDFKEGVAAFNEKRPAQFKGR